MHTEQQTILAQNQKLEREYKDMSKRSANFEKMYRALKHQQINPNVELAAEHGADNVIQNASQNPGGQYRGSQQQQQPPRPGFQRRSGSNGSAGSNERRRVTLRPGAGYGGQGYVPPGSRMGMNSSRESGLPYSSSFQTDKSQTALQSHRRKDNVCQRISPSQHLVHTLPLCFLVELMAVIRTGKVLLSMAATVVVARAVV